MKKILCSMLSLLLILVFSLPATAKVSPNSFLIDSLFNHLILMNEYDQSKNYLIGKPIPVLEFDNSVKNSLILLEEYRVYPISINNEPSLLAYYTGDFIKIADIQDEELIYAFSSNENLFFIQSCGQIFLCDEDSIVYTNCEDNDLLFSKVNAILNNIEINNYSLDEPVIGTIHFSNSPTRYGTCLNMPLKSQSPYYDGCWAACIASFDSYYNNRNTSVSDVVHDITGSYSQVSSRSIAEVCNYLRLYYDIVAINKPINSNFCTDLRNDIDNNKAYMGFWRFSYIDQPNAPVPAYHFTVIDGYSITNNTYSYMVMDPMNSSNMTAGRYSVSASSSTAIPINSSMIYYVNGYTSPKSTTATLYGAIKFSYLNEGA